ncbi:hypothetical protein GCM10010193_69610 [Kitasatospora atroaurantiaca]|uniref:Helix-turn-helix protein n=1 Tax=Kitasatospora atroaurantiaca TaxID=285545 RepID=A0A561EN53_9ACTN|nr:helix-turn-helix transcriptional regulator [Kitasatospora atroaurantiaca]TWE17046.1 helix-turn-helix protein [Kitasatospora atroaurantiaca]
MTGHQKTPEGTAVSRRAGANVRRLRRRAGMTAAQLAQEMTALGMPISTQNVTRLETGVSGSGGHPAMSVDLLIAFAAVLQVGPEVLLAEPACWQCSDLPPEGFACRACGAEG